MLTSLEMTRVEQWEGEGGNRMVLETMLAKERVPEALEGVDKELREVGTLAGTQ